MMEYNIYRERTWSDLLEDEIFTNAKLVDSQDCTNLGIHKYKNHVYTSGFAGVTRLIDEYNNPLVDDDMNEDILIVSPKYSDTEVWKMLETVICDEEYEDYIRELEQANKILFEIFYDQLPIELEREDSRQSDLLCALSFVSNVYLLCHKGLKTDWIEKKENLFGKIKGKIDVGRNIKENTIKGRNERFACKYIERTKNTAENRIIKKALIVSKRIIKETFGNDCQIMGRIQYCLSCFSDVELPQIINNDLKKAKVGGIYSYYKPSLKMAKMILENQFYFYSSNKDGEKEKSTYVIPYAINMETVFEFYSRAKIRECLKTFGHYSLEDYSKRLYPDINHENNVSRIHLMEYCIPDIIIKDEKTGKYIAVLDAKYKDHLSSNREDSHQLLSYVLQTGTSICGFIMPLSEKELKNGKSCLKEVNKPRTVIEICAPEYQRKKDDVHYFEVLLGTSIDKSLLIEMGLEEV